MELVVTGQLLTAADRSKNFRVERVKKLKMAFYRSRGLITEDLLNCDRVAEQKFRRGQLQQKAVKETQENR